MRQAFGVTQRNGGRSIAALVGMMLLACFSAPSQSQSTDAKAQSYPSRPITIIMPIGAGGAADILGRYVGQKLSQSLGQPVVVDNRAGAGGIIGTQVAAKAAPDGYTLLWAYPSHFINPSLYTKLPYDTVNDFAPITHVATVDLALAINTSVPAIDVKELITLAKAKPGSMNYGAVGEGSLGHLAGVTFNRMAGVDFVLVPYKSTPQVEVALLANEVQVFFTLPLTAAPQVKAGKIRALAVTSSHRSSTFPDVPTMEEAGLRGYEIVGVHGILAPAGVPKEIVHKLNDELVRILRRPDVKEWFASQGLAPVGSSPEEFGARIKADSLKWANIVKDAGIKPKAL